MTALLALTLRDRGRRVLLLLAFSALFLTAAVTAAVLGRGEAGHVEMDQIFVFGGLPLVSALLLAGWLVGRFPLLAALVLLSGVVSEDRQRPLGRLLAVRPVSPIAVYGARFITLAGLAFLFCAVVMPAFDLLILGQWAGPATLVLIAADLLVYGGLTALLSVWTRNEGWIVLLLVLTAMVWDALGRAGMLPLVPPLAELVAFLLPPQGALFALEAAFAEVEPIPWGAFGYAAGYGGATLILAALSLRMRER